MEEKTRCANSCKKQKLDNEPCSCVKVFGNNSCRAEKYHVESCDTFSKEKNISSEAEGINVKSSSITDCNYFRCYADASIHRLMIGDYIRTETYRKAILSNYKLFYKKVVADVGAGTGILSLFCAQAGAKKVYAIEASSIAEEARKVITANGFNDRICVIQGKVEDISLPEEVDVIVSEWMGYMLVYESMLSSVLYARDKWLKPGGHMFPNEVKMYIAPFSDPTEYEESVEFWSTIGDTFKVNMSPLMQVAEQQMKEYIHVVSVHPEKVQAHAHCIAEIDLQLLGAYNAGCIESSFKFSCFGYTDIHGFVVWFTAHFPNKIVLSTSPYEEQTHWEQTVMYITPEQVTQDTMIKGHICIRRNETYHRFLNVELEYKVDDSEKKIMKYQMSN